MDFRLRSAVLPACSARLSPTRSGRRGFPASPRAGRCAADFDILAETTAWRPEGPALTFKGTATHVPRAVGSCRGDGRDLQRLGLGRGHRVAVYLDKRVETTVSVFATSIAGGVFVPVNPLLRPRQVTHIVDDCAARVLITSADRFDQLEDQLAECKSIELVVLVGERERPARGAATSSSGRRWPRPVPAEAGAVDLDMAAILYTSGSTGRPKGVVLSHRNLLVGESVGGYLGNDERRHPGGAARSASTPASASSRPLLHEGAHVVLMNYLLPGDVVRLCAKHRVTGLTCVPPLWIQLAEQLDPGGQRLPALLRQHRRTHAAGDPRPAAGHLPPAEPFLMCRLTEAFRSTYLDPAEVDRRPDSIGKAIPNAEILVVREDGSPCDPNERASSSIRARWWRWATGTTRAARPSASARTAPRGRTVHHRAGGVLGGYRHHDEGFSISWAARTT